MVLYRTKGIASRYKTGPGLDTYRNRTKQKRLSISSHAHSMLVARPLACLV